MLTAFTRLRLVSDGRRPTMLVRRRGVSGDTQIKLPFRVGSFSLTAIEVRSATSRERKLNQEQKSGEQRR